MTTHRGRPRGKQHRFRLVFGGAVALATVALAATLAATASAASPFLEPVDAQSWVDQAELTHADFKPVPDRRPEYYDNTSVGSQNQYKTAIILVDYSDQPFLISQPSNSHPFGNPQPGWTPVAPEEVNEWMRKYYDEPNVYNGFHTLHSYWMEDTHGKIGVDVTVFGPYRMPGRQWEYGLATDFNGAVGTQANSSCPAGATCNRNIRNDGAAAWRAATGCPPATPSNPLCGFDNGFYVTAGHDESSTWQEFGEMLWTAREQVPAKFGPPGAENGPVLNAFGNPIPNWAPTRYVPWTSWRAAANHWPNAGGGTSTQAESSGQSVFAHEFSHLRGLPDNYNNPFSDVDRNYTGYWEMMSRGTFNGPGGTHNRWQIPNAGGSALGPHHLLHFKNSLSALTATEQVTLQRNDLASQGAAVMPIKARESVPGSDLAGLTVVFGTGGDLAGTCANQGYTAPFFYCPNRTGSSYLHYRMEVVDQVGNDSFAPGHGVLLTKSRNSGTPSVWMIDPNPQDIGMIDFYRPDGTPVAVVRGDPRQLNDATFHAGTNSGSEYEYKDDFNRLHFYVLRKYRNADGVLFYDVGVRRYDGAGPFARGLSLGSPSRVSTDLETAKVQVPLTNTGEAGTGVFDSDVYRLSAGVSGAGWSVSLPYAVVSAKAGQTIDVSAIASHADGSAGSAVVTVTATSETDPTKTQTVSFTVYTAEGSIANVTSLIESMQLAKHIAKQLQETIDDVEKKFDNGNLAAACRTVDLFVVRVNAREGSRPGLTAAQAAELRTAAEAIRRALAC